MATGIIGSMSGPGTISYTAQSNSKVAITYTGSSTYCRVNGAQINVSGSPTGANVIHWVGAGQTITITTTGGDCLVSCLGG